MGPSQWICHLSTQWISKATYPWNITSFCQAWHLSTTGLSHERLGGAWQTPEIVYILLMNLWEHNMPTKHERTSQWNGVIYQVTAYNTAGAEVTEMERLSGWLPLPSTSPAMSKVVILTTFQFQWWKTTLSLHAQEIRFKIKKISKDNVLEDIICHNFNLRLWLRLKVFTDDSSAVITLCQSHT